MTKITPEHLVRGAVVYVRQSTAIQVVQNLESQRRQYGLADRARQLGWADVEVIDDDLGRSGAGARRPGFEKLLAAICEGRVGAVLSLEASRLARNGRDWHTLLEFCGLVGTLIVDEDGIYDPASPNDRLLLGMKGTMSEMELSVFPSALDRSDEAEGTPRRTLPHRGGRVCEGWWRSHREGCGPTRPRGHRAGVPQVRRASDDSPGSGVVPAGEGSLARSWARAGPLTAGLSGACQFIRPSITC